jgi:hypothetical protein
MKIHKLTIIVCDPNEEDVSARDIKVDIENSLDRIVHFISIETKNSRGEWNDNSPFNFGAKKAENAFNNLSPK